MLRNWLRAAASRGHAHPQRPRKGRMALACAATAALLTGAQIAPASADTGGTATAGGTTYTETYRPQFHFSPAKNWMNDPNGLLYYRGEYHLFFQYNPSGNTWGNMSWGHAVSTDLVHWSELPVAIPQDDQNMSFSGSAVIDYTNTTGFGQPGNPAMVAVYTAASKVDGKQRQAIAYSLDRGRTFTKYGVVLDIDSYNFRDPKVFWYAPGHEWLMTAALSDQHKVTFYTSPDLKHWTHLSDFGPAGATGGVWECPDLFPLPDPNHPGKQKWVLVVNLNPGAIAGGSGAQYFTGNFDGTTFTSDDKPYTPPAGTDLGSFDNGSFGGWTATGSAFGSGPTPGNAPGQGGVSGYVGSGLANSYNNAALDNATGTLRSPDFTIDQDYLNFLVGGGNHPYVPGGSTTAPSGTVLQDFEGDSLPGWTGTGSFANITPTKENLPGQLGGGVLDTCQQGCDAAEGTITSPTFDVTARYLDLLVAGGNHPISGPSPTAVNVLVDGQVVASATGNNSGSMNWQALDLGAYAGRQAQIQVVDLNDGSNGWGHLMVDDLILSDTKANPWNDETGVNLVVNDQVVRSATGPNSESLDWTHWNVSDLKGSTAHIELVDNNTGGWGHILADQFSLSATPALSAVERAHWVDFGSDDYAAVTYNDAPGGKRIMIGWMNNWNYGGSIPTSPWRSAMTVPRELSLRNIDGVVQLFQAPVPQLNELRGGPTVHLENRPIPSGTTALPANGAALHIDATLGGGSASNYGLKVRTGNGQETVIGFDRANSQLYIDRTRSGNVNFDPSFPGVQTAPLASVDGVVHLEVLVDWSSVEVFAQDGQVLLTDQIFPDPSSVGMATFANSGTALLRSLTVQPMRSAWNTAPGRQ